MTTLFDPARFLPTCRIGSKRDSDTSCVITVKGI